MNKMMIFINSIFQRLNKKAETNIVWIKIFGLNKYISCIIFQKCFRINASVPWLVHFTSTVSSPEKIKRLNEEKYEATKSPFVGMSPHCYIQAINGIEFGYNTIIGPGVNIISANHNIYDYNLHGSAKPIRIGNNCWIGANVTILPGVELADHTIVAAGAVVSKSFLEGDCIIGGVPAKIIKKIGKYGHS